jgi:hypothetical protein
VIANPRPNVRKLAVGLKISLNPSAAMPCGLCISANVSFVTYVLLPVVPPLRMTRTSLERGPVRVNAPTARYDADAMRTTLTLSVGALDLARMLAARASLPPRWKSPLGLS